MNRKIPDKSPWHRGTNSSSVFDGSTLKVAVLGLACMFLISLFCSPILADITQDTNDQQSLQAIVNQTALEPATCLVNNDAHGLIENTIVAAETQTYFSAESASVVNNPTFTAIVAENGLNDTLAPALEDVEGLPPVIMAIQNDAQRDGDDGNALYGQAGLTWDSVLSTQTVTAG